MFFLAYIQSECFSDAVTVICLADEFFRRSLDRMASIGITFSIQHEVLRKFPEFLTKARESVRAKALESRARKEEARGKGDRDHRQTNGKGGHSKSSGKPYYRQGQKGFGNNYNNSTPFYQQYQSVGTDGLGHQSGYGYQNFYNMGAQQSSEQLALPAAPQGSLHNTTGAPVGSIGAPPFFLHNQKDDVSNTSSDITLREPLSRRPFVVRMICPGNISDSECHLDDLVLDGYAGRAAASGGDQGLRTSGYALEQPRGIWEVFDRFLEGSSPPDALFSLPFPPSHERPLPRDVADACKYVASTPAPCIEAYWLDTRRRLLELKKWSTEHPAYTEWHSSVSPDIRQIVKSFDPLFFSATAAFCGIDVSSLVYLFKVGFPSVGKFTAKGVYPDSESGDCISVQELLDSAGDKWGELPSLFRNEADCDGLWQEALGEVEKGWLDPPTHIGNINKSPCVPARRFGVIQGSKTRSCDNLRRSLTNKAADVGSKIRLPGPDDLARIVEDIQKGGVHSQLGFLKGDHESAYKQLPLRPSHSLLSLVSLESPVDSQVWCFRPRTLVFGSSAAVLAYNVFAKAVAAIVTRLYGCPFINFFDDYASAGPLSLVGLMVSLFIEFCDLVGIKCKISKCSFGPEIDFLGLHMSLPGGMACATLPDDKRARYRHCIMEILQGNTCTPLQASELAGKLNFGISFLWGRGCRVYMKHIYKHASGISPAMSPGMRSALEWWSAFLRDPIPRFFISHNRNIGIVMHTDASLFGLGVFLYAPNFSEVFSCAVPPGYVEGLPPGSSPIYYLELLAALLGARILCDIAKAWDNPRNVVHGIDNNPALVSLLRGYAKDEEACKIIQEYWHAQVRSSCPVWLDRVRSSANLADAPSRGVGGSRCVAFPVV